MTERIVGDGTFELKISAGSYVGTGWLTLLNGRIFGGDRHLSLQGMLRRDGAAVVGGMTIDAGPDAPPPLRDRGRFYLEARGVSDGDGFNLIGAGPLGVIIELSCHRTES